MERIKPYNNKLYVLEGIFSACRFHNYNLPAIAVLGNNPKQLTNWLNMIPYEIIKVCDGDSAGRLYKSKNCSSINLPDEKYIDEMSEEELHEFLMRNNIIESVTP